MTILSTVFLVIAGIVAFILILATFTKKKYTIERSIVIDRSKQEVFDFVKFIKNQDRFSVWANMDPVMKKEYRGTDGTPGFVSSWESDHKRVGKGEQTIKKITDGERIDIDLHFIAPWDGRADAAMVTSAVTDHQTRVTWSFHSSMKYPMNVMLLVMNMDQMVGNDLQTGLENLKVLLEKEDQQE